MTDELRARLAAAASAGEVIRVVYHRGTQPGTVRAIVPVAIRGGEVRARDIATGIEKSFKLAHLQLAETAGNAPTYVSGLPATETRTLAVALEPHVGGLRALGWHVEATDLSVSICRYFRNGKPRKGAEVAILFNEFSTDAWDDGNGWREEAVRSTRPYYVSSPTFDRARTFAHLAAALAVFLEEARKLAPVIGP